MTDAPIHAPCVICDRPVYRRIGESAAKWRLRKTCREECRYAMSGQTIRAAALRRDEMAAKPCAVCGEMMTRNKTEGRERFAGRATCSRKCHGRLSTMRAFGSLEQAPKRPRGENLAPSANLKPCVCCGQPIPWPRGLTAAAYRGKSTCGADACKNGQQGRPAASRLAAELVSPPSSLYRPNEAQRREWRLATPAERRLFAPEIRAALGGANA